MKIAVIGAGGWGTVIAGVISTNNKEVALWARDKELAKTLTVTRENKKYLSGYLLPDSVSVANSLEDTLDNAELIAIAVPSYAARQILMQIKPYFKDATPVVSLTKGMEIKTTFRMSEVIKDVLGTEDDFIAVLSGPNHAEEVSRKIPTAAVIASLNKELITWLQPVFMTNEFRVYANTDLIGVEIAGIVKNVIAIAAGISDGLGFGDNTKATLITRGLAEIARLGGVLGAQKTTFWGLAGVGDLIATCTSRHSRNRLFGQRIGSGEKVEDIRASMDMVAEGIYSAKAIDKLSGRLGVEMPICKEVYSVLYEGKSPLISVSDLMTRDATYE